MYGIPTHTDEAIHSSKGSIEADIEAEINQEIQGMRGSEKESLFRSVKVDIKCGKKA